MIEKASNPIIIGIAGASGSGKSLFANTIVNEIGSEQVVVLSEDSYYKNQEKLSLEARGKLNYDHPDAFDHPLLCEHLRQLKAGEAIKVPSYDFTTHTRSSKLDPIPSGKSIIVLEGILLFVDPELRKLMDIRIYVDTSLDIAFIRRLRRDVLERGRSMESVIEQYETTVRPMFIKFIEPSKRYADIIVPHGGKNRIAIDMIKAKMKELLHNHAYSVF